MKIKISVLDKNGEEVDFITRDLPYLHNYDFIQGLLVDLSLLANRNTARLNIVNHGAVWIIELLGNYIRL